MNNAYSLISYFKVKENKVWIINLPYSKDVMTNHMGMKVSTHYRYILHSDAMVSAVKNVFKYYTNLNLYDKIKTFYKYDI